MWAGRIETTFQEINQHFKLKTIHTWSDTSVNRTAPIIIASYSLACLVVNESTKNEGPEITPQSTSWYEKKVITFSDVMVYLKLLILNKKHFSQSGVLLDCGKIEVGELLHLITCAKLEFVPLCLIWALNDETLYLKAEMLNGEEFCDVA